TAAPPPLSLLHPPPAAPRLAYDLHSVLKLEEGAQPLADDGVVVDDEDADGISHRARPGARSFPFPASSRSRAGPSGAVPVLPSTSARDASTEARERTGR